MLAEQTFFFLFYVLASLVKDSLTIGVRVYFRILSSVPLVCLSVLILVPHCFDDCGFVVFLEVWESYASCLVFVLQNCLAILGLLWFHINFWIVCSSSVKNVMGHLIGIALNL